MHLPNSTNRIFDRQNFFRDLFIRFRRLSFAGFQIGNIKVLISNGDLFPVSYDIARLPRKRNRFRDAKVFAVQNLAGFRLTDIYPFAVDRERSDVIFCFFFSNDTASFQINDREPILWRKLISLDCCAGMPL